MIKFLFATDTHATMKGPGTRTDSYPQAVKRKLTELSLAAQQLGVEAVIHGGDLFDKPVVSNDLVGEVAEIIRESGVDWLIVPGNHDLFGYNIDTLPQTSLGVLSRTGVISILDRKAGPVYWGGIKTISFEGQEYHKDIDKRDPALDYYVTSDADFRILIPHSMLLDKPYFPDVPHTLTKDLDKVPKDARPDQIFVGHYHDGYAEHCEHEIDILNPGSMLRDEASKGNIKRIPQYVLLTIHEMPAGLSVATKLIPFKTAVEGKKIFDRTKIEEKQSKERYLQSFEQRLTDNALDAVDVRSVLDKTIVQDKAIPRDIAIQAHERLTAAEKSLNTVTEAMTGYLEKPDNIYMTKLTLKGFQSHEHSTIEFGPGFNAITGPSDAGKSSIIRAMRFVLYNEPRGSDFIRQSSGGVEVVLHFSDGSYIRRSRSRSSAGVYAISHNGNKELELQGFTNNVPVDVANVHQMPYLQLAKDLEKSLNIGTQHEAPFLIGESPSTRAAIIGKLTGVNLVDTAMREISKDILDNNKSVKLWDAQLETVENEFAQYEDLPFIRKQIDDAEAMIKNLEAVEKEMADLTTIKHGLDQAAFNETNLRKQIADADQIMANASLVAHIQSLHDSHKQLTELQNGIHKYSKLEASIQGELTALQKVTVSIEEIDSLAAYTHEMQTLVQLRDNMAGNRATLHDIHSQIRLADLEITTAEFQYQSILEEAGQCPTCNQIILRGAHAHG